MTPLEHMRREMSALPSQEFSEEALYTPAGQSGRRVPVIFDRTADVLEIGEMIELDGVAAVAHVATDLVPEIARDDVMVVRSLTYRVVGVEPTGRGLTMLTLGI